MSRQPFMALSGARRLSSCYTGRGGISATWASAKPSRRRRADKGRRPRPRSGCGYRAWWRGKAALGRTWLRVGDGPGFDRCCVLETPAGHPAGTRGSITSAQPGPGWARALTSRRATVSVARSARSPPTMSSRTRMLWFVVAAFRPSHRWTWSCGLVPGLPPSEYLCGDRCVHREQRVP